MTYLKSRRTSQRCFLLRPDADGAMQQLYLYSLAACANQHGVKVHCFFQMSNCPHEIFTDVQGVLPDFLKDFHQTLANCTKVHRGWPEEVFNKSQTSCVELASDEVVVDKVGYVMAQGCAAFLVRHAKDWPGARVTVDEIGRKVIRVKRPDLYFDPNNPRWPEEVTLEITMPPGLIERLGEEEARRQMKASVREHERKALAAAKKEGKKFLGADRVLKTRITERGRSWERFGGRNPTFATGGDGALFRALVERRRTFRSGHAASLSQWRAGDREVPFPHGTWWMRVHHRARVDEPPG